MDYNKELEVAKRLAVEAGNKIMEIYNAEESLKTPISKKVDKNKYESPLTLADLSANETIVSELRKVFPNYAILSEEEADNKERLKKDFVWIIDPLDGTKEFISRHGEFTVNIALAQKGER